MFLASNRYTGLVLAYPDVCLTPVGPVVVPIPYLNVSFNLTAVIFPTVVLINSVNALNLGSVLAISTGDEPGVAHWTIKGPAVYVGGFPKLFIEGMPGACLLAPTFQNTLNALAGAQLVPSATNVIYGQRALAEAPPRAVPRRMLDDETGYLALSIFTTESPARVRGAIRDLEEQGARAIVLDLRGNPGGEIAAALALAGDFLPPGSVIARVVDADGDEVEHRARAGEPCTLPLAVIVDHDTASAAELFAGSLQAHGRARVVGAATHGKGTGQAFVPDLEGGDARYATVARLLLPDGRAIEGAGIRPDHDAGEDAIAVAAGLTATPFNVTEPGPAHDTKEQNSTQGRKGAETHQGERA